MTHESIQPRVTIHDLTAVERELLGGLFANAGGVASRDFVVAALACAAARGLRAETGVSITTAGLVIELPAPVRAE